MGFLGFLVVLILATVVALASALGDAFSIFA